MALQSDHEFAPTEIARAVFPTAFRGYDQDAVRRYLSRLAAALEHQQTFEELGELQVRTPVHDRVDELETEIVALQDEIRELETELVQRSVDQADEGSRRSTEVVEFDEARAIELLGQETARVLESARSAAAEILKRAENQAVSLKSEAKKELAEARRQAKQLVADKNAEAEAAIDELTEEAERAANRITGDAEEHRVAVVEESSKILADAESKAEAERVGAQNRARQIVADAEALRHQVVAELVSDRRSAQGDLDQMIEARDRLALSLAVARSELDELADQLSEVVDGPSGQGAGRPVEVDGDEVARLIERLDAERNDGEPNDADALVPGDDDVDGDRASEVSARKGERRRSTIDEPTVEMPAVTHTDTDTDTDTDDADADDDEPAGDEATRAGDAIDTGRSNGVFDGDDEDLVDDRRGRPEDDVDIDLAGSSDVLNSPPADGVPLSLVEGFSTIVLSDEHARNRDAEVGRSSDGHAVDLVVDDLLGHPIDDSVDPASIITTVSARADGLAATGTRGDLLLDQPSTERLPEYFGARDVAVTRSESNLRRQLRRALNDDQSGLLDRLRSGRGAIDIEELQDEQEQVEQFLAPLRRGLTDIARAGARAGGADDVTSASLDNLIEQLASYVVARVRTPTVAAIVDADHDDREKILEPIRSLYRDFRNIGLPELANDALHEAFAIGFYDSIPDGSPVSWVVDPRTDPDPVCEVNRERSDLIKGEVFPSGHVRPLSLPGCRCLVVGID